MHYTVVRDERRPDRESDDDTALVGAQLIKEGIAIDRVPRVRPEGRQNGWLYVWRSREEAENAAEQLQRRTGGSWRVTETGAEPSIGPLRWVQIDIGRESDGLVFALDPITRLMVRQRFPGSCRHRSVFLGVEPDDDLAADAPHFLEVARHVLYLLTWVPADELAVFGEFVVFDPASRRVLLPETRICP